VSQPGGRRQGWVGGQSNRHQVNKNISSEKKKKNKHQNGNLSSINRKDENREKCIICGK